MVYDEYWMGLALEQARQADNADEVPVGAVIVRDGAILGQGFNQPISAADPTAHAEVVALRAAAQAVNNYRLPGAVLYVTLEPCAMCAGAIIHSRIERVVFAASEPKAGAVCSHLRLFEQPQMNHHVSWQQGVMETESADLIQGFFARRRQQRREARKALTLGRVDAGQAGESPPLK
ncbi:tRNA adenosine(34) deaminase TadA [Spongiibacter sp. KMU-166]|uniref:tRNA-specific adenosine deaminase n=1 Tax=Spongiibacter thalassae TaxID=2721624 RepID=A0ABX1GCP1_9GAMM|nr:tRNA adenosine(34) deaminase TadA [Spongiibacter thalassae]NKI16934.1 tRNA adenosine(34) deaminase TadA [Spongiibacter thalassae]